MNPAAPATAITMRLPVAMKAADDGSSDGGQAKRGGNDPGGALTYGNNSHITLTGIASPGSEILQHHQCTYGCHPGPVCGP